MPRSIAAYTKADPESARLARRKPLPVPILLIGLVLLCFGFTASSDALAKANAVDASETQKAKLCMGEFGQKNCNSLSLTPDCLRLFQCIQMEKSTPSTMAYNFARSFAEEFQADYQLPTVIVTILLLIQLINTIHENGAKHQ
jgi:hypothetical protein